MNTLQLDTLTTYANWAAREARRDALILYRRIAVPRNDPNREKLNEMIDNHFVHEVKQTLQHLMQMINS